MESHGFNQKENKIESQNIVNSDSKKLNYINTTQIDVEFENELQFNVYQNSFSKNKEQLQEEIQQKLNQLKHLQQKLDYEVIKEELLMDIVKSKTSNAKTDDQDFNDLEGNMVRGLLHSDPFQIDLDDLKFQDIQQNYFQQLHEYQSNKNEYLNVQFMSDLQYSLQYHDNYPLLSQRKYFIQAKSALTTFCDIIIQHRLFQISIMIIIIMNSVILASYSSNTSQDNPTYKAFDDFFYYVYIIEMFLKIFALGFIFNSNAYLRDNWNVLDFIIVATSIISKEFNFENVQALRVLRVLRPLRSVSRVKSLKKMMNALFSSFQMLKDNIIIMLFYYVVFSVTGQQIFGGYLKQNCINLNEGIVYVDEQNYQAALCAEDSDCKISPFTHCAKTLKNPQYNLLNFDTFLYSFLQVFQQCTLEGWTEIMIDLQITYNFSTFMYCFILVSIGSFVIVNLILAVVAIKFLQAQSNVNMDDPVEPTQWSLKECQSLGIIEQRKHQHRQSLKQEKLKTLRQTIADFKHHTIQEFIKYRNFQISDQNILKKAYIYLKNLCFKRKQQSDEDIDNQKQNENQQLFNKNKDVKDNTYDQIDFSGSRQTSQKQFMKKIITTKDNSQQSKKKSSNSIHEANEIKINEKQEKSLRSSYHNLGNKQKDDEINDFTISSSCSISIEQELIKNENNNVDLEENYYNKKEVKNIFTQQKLQMIRQSTLENDNKKQIVQNIPQEQILDAKDAQNQQLVNEETTQQMNLNSQSNIQTNIVEDQEGIQRENIIRFLVPVKHRLTIGQNKDQEIDYESSLDVMQHRPKLLLMQEEIIKNNNLKLAAFKINYTQYNQLGKLDYIQKDKYNEYCLKKEKIEKRQLSLQNRIQSIYYHSLHNYLNQNYQGVNFPYQKNQISLKEILSIQDQEQFKSYEKQQSKQRIKKQKKQAQLTEDYFTISQFLQDQKNEDESHNYHQIDEQQFKEMQNEIGEKYKDIQNYILQKKEDGQTDIITLFPGVEIFKAYYYQNNDIFQNFIQKRQSKLIQGVHYQQINWNVWDQKLHGHIRGIRRFLFRMISSQIFDNIIMLTVIANTITMALNGFEFYQKSKDQFENANNAFTYIFIVEMFLKICALLPTGYVRDKMNLFDGFIVIISIIDLISSNQNNISAFRSFRIIRTLRVLRVTRLLRSLEYITIIIKAVSSCLANFINIFVLMFIFLFIFSLLANNFFGNNIQNQDILSQDYYQNWNTFESSIMNTFQIMTLENWNTLMYISLETSNPKFLTILYYLIWIFAGNYVLLNLFLAILLDGFTINQDNNPDDLIDEYEQLYQKQSFEIEEKQNIFNQVSNNSIIIIQILV